MSIADTIGQIETNQRLAAGAGNPSGYFGAMLLRLLRELVSEGSVDERLLQAAASRYLDVWDDYQAAKEDIVTVWRVVFDSGAVEQWRQSLLISQQLMLSAQAHIGYDLPAAAMEVCSSRDELSALKAGYATYSKRVFEALTRAKEDVAKYSPLADTLDMVGAHANVLEPTALRKLSWRLAGVLVSRPKRAPLVLMNASRMFAELSRRLREPGEEVAPIVDFVRVFEGDDDEFGIGEVMDAIAGIA